MNPVRLAAGLSLALAGLALPLAAPLAAQCSPPSGPGGLGPDVIVSDLLDPLSYGQAGGYFAYSIGTMSCNIGTAELFWVEDTTEHPVIAQNLYRLENGRFEQIGMSWLKHGFTALQLDECGCACVPSALGGTRLGVGCSDPYIASLNGNQNGLGPRSEVFDPAAGLFIYPPILDPANPDLTWRRLRVNGTDIDPALHPGALWFAEAHYVTPDDAAAGNGGNNASHRQVSVAADASRTIAYVAPTMAQQAAIHAWAAQDPSVTIVEVPDGSGGLLLLGTKVTSLGGGQWAYEYALHNLSSTRAVRTFEVPLPEGAVATAIGFHDVEYHSGELYSGTDWLGTSKPGLVDWITTPFSIDPNANALRWSTLYNFRFVAAAAPVAAAARLEHFTPGTPSSVTAPTLAPAGDFTLPVSGVACALASPDVVVTWSNGEAYDAVEVLRDGAVIATLAGGATSHADTAPPPGPHTYGVRGIDGAVPSLPVECSIDFPAPLALSLPGGPLAEVAPDGGDTLGVQIDALPGFAVAPGSEVLWLDTGTGFAAIPLAPLGGNQYSATFPPIPCGTVFAYYVGAESTTGIEITLPAGGAADPFIAESSFGSVDSLDPLDAPGGWLVGPPNTAISGNWVHGDPNGTLAQPEDDHSPVGANCWFTGQGPPGGASTAADVDGSTATNGLTTLYSPFIDLAGATDPTIGYWRWYSNNQGAAPGSDVFTVEISENGLDWVNVETVGPTGAETGGGWFEHTFRVFDLIAPSASTQLRFIASDLGGGSTIEAAIDDLAVHDPICTDPDCNQNGIDDQTDIATGTSQDCNVNGFPDECDIASGQSEDCDGNAVPDICDIALGAPDCDLDGVPDGCEFAAGGDCDLDGTLDDCEIIAGAPDCNLNGDLDTCDIAAGASQDTDQDGIPDECQLPDFRRGDANADGSQNIADAVRMLEALFQGVAVPCQAALDANGDATVNIADPVRLLGYLFSGQPPLPPPFPGCGGESPPSGLSCGAFAACP